MLFSATIRYALLTLAALPEDHQYYQASILAKELELPGQYLSKILQTLVRKGLLESLTGPDGGFRLARPAHHITVGEVAQVLGEKESPSGCVLGLPTSEGHQHPCQLFNAWRTIKGTTIRDLALLKRPCACPRQDRVIR